MINIIFSQEYKKHDTGNHPESIERIKVVNNLIKEEYSKHNLKTLTKLLNTRRSCYTQDQST